MSERLYCKIFVKSDMDSHMLLSLIEKCMWREHDGRRGLVTRVATLDLFKNDGLPHGSRGKEIPAADRESFLYWRYYLDVEPRDAVDRSDYVAQIKQLLCFLRDEEIQAIPACAFEDELS